MSLWTSQHSDSAANSLFRSLSVCVSISSPITRFAILMQLMVMVLRLLLLLLMVMRTLRAPRQSANTSLAYYPIELSLTISDFGFHHPFRCENSNSWRSH